MCAGTLTVSSSAYDEGEWPGAGSGVNSRSEPACGGTSGHVKLMLTSVYCPLHGQAPSERYRGAPQPSSWYHDCIS